ncbi:MAG: hypothetical protein AAF585_03830, partial [Verrucomicrobiota bacterium]
MKNANTILGTALCLILFSSCETSLGPVAKLPEGAAAGSEPVAEVSPREAEFRRGKALLNAGDHVGAMKQFAYLRDHAGSAEERDRAVIGLSMALQDSGKTG